MNKVFCIYPTDQTTEFLLPVFNTISKFQGVISLAGDSREDLFYERFKEILLDESLDTFIFLGHGNSKYLYGSGFNILIPHDELFQINHKKFILFSCNSSDLLENIQSKCHIGFGFIPSELEDLSSMQSFHKMDLSSLKKEDIDYLRKKYVSAWLRALDGLPFFDIEALGKRLYLFLNRAIVDTLMDKSIKNRRLISDILFYIKSDLQVKVPSIKYF